ncbi:MAG TPA: PhzF family phenazine biosynthesis protein [Ktedonobacterales bacterium]|nr:PhzF family phenazine biosynthesis protein [Ktedonobacterales bacterium]
MMRRIPYTQLDVFTTTPFGGNQLAVFFDADALFESEMQSIAREMNFSESTFVLPPSDPARALCRVRIFTPGGELPFAGHPTIGTTVALVHAGRLTAENGPTTLELGVGPLTVEPVFTHGELSFVWMTQPAPTFTLWDGDRAALLAALGLDEAALRDDLPIERGSAGVPFIYVPLRDREVLRKAAPGAGLHAALPGEDPHTGVYLFVAPEIRDGSAPVYARMFAPGMGIVEDAATGAAAGPMGVYLARHGALALGTNGRGGATVVQGVEMGRYSEIAVEFQFDGGAVTSVRVAGAAVVVARGEFILPDRGGVEDLTRGTRA